VVGENCDAVPHNAVVIGEENLGEDASDEERYAKLVKRLEEASNTGYGSKFNDLKPLYGSLFQEQLAEYSHWGWFDLDCFMGDMRATLTP
jgi:hypothetical protein